MLRTERPALSAIGFLPIHSNTDTLAISHTLEIVILIVHCHAFGGKKEASVDTVIRARVKPEACTWIGAERRAGHNGPMAPERITALFCVVVFFFVVFVFFLLVVFFVCFVGF